MTDTESRLEQEKEARDTDLKAKTDEVASLAGRLQEMEDKTGGLETQCGQLQDQQAQATQQLKVKQDAISSLDYKVSQIQTSC